MENLLCIPYRVQAQLSEIHVLVVNGLWVECGEDEKNLIGTEE
jgi:hypothetical protein